MDNNVTNQGEGGPINRNGEILAEFRARRKRRKIFILIIVVAVIAYFLLRG